LQGEKSEVGTEWETIEFWPSVSLVSVYILLLPLISARPILERSNNAACNRFATVQSGSYTVNTNLWGSTNANSGSQCTHLLSITGDVLKWYTNWEWNGGSGVKSYSNAQLDVGINKQLSAITSMPSTWAWTYSSTKSIVANVAYDFFTAWSAGGSNAVEVMVWIGNYAAGPISYAYDASGNAIPIEKNLSIAGHKWNLYLGSNVGTCTGFSLT